MLSCYSYADDGRLGSQDHCYKTKSTQQGRKTWLQEDYLELDGVDDLEDDEQDHAPGTTKMLDWIKSQWHE